MKKTITAALTCAILLVSGAAALANLPALPALKQPVLMTPFGQSQDANAVNLMARPYQVECNMTVTADDVDWSAFKTMIVVIGGSDKGLDAAGLDTESELARCRALIKAAREHGVYILAMHVGGKDRRAPNSEPFLGFAGDADYMIVRSDGDADDYFNNLCAKKKVPLYPIESTSELRQLFPQMMR